MAEEIKDYSLYKPVTFQAARFVAQSDIASYQYHYIIPPDIFEANKASIDIAGTQPISACGSSPVSVYGLIEDLKKGGAILHELNGDAADIEYYIGEIHSHYTYGQLTSVMQFAHKDDKPGIEKPKPSRETYYAAGKGGYYSMIFRDGKDDIITGGFNRGGKKMFPWDIAKLNELQQAGQKLGIEPV